MSSADVDVLVSGAGPVGIAAALFLRKTLGAQARIVLIDARAEAYAPHDRRMIAVSAATCSLLQSARAWSAPGATAIEHIHISQRGAFGQTRIDAADYDLPAVGYVVPYPELIAPLLAQLEPARLVVRRCVRIERSVAADTHATLHLSDGSTVSTHYLLHAEGGVFHEQSARRVHRDYQQSALTGFVTVALPRPATAFERFTEAGPIALLPAKRDAQSGYALVWCDRPDAAERHLHQADDVFLRELHGAFGDRLGAFRSIQDRGLYPLGLNVATPPSSVRELTIGNAAQTLHPVAGQGFNLGMRDAWLAATVLGEHFARPQSVHTQFASARRRDRALTIGMTDFLPRVFASRLWPVVAARGAALTILDCIPALRHPLARQMMRGQR